jgi:hypothetical protein
MMNSPLSTECLRFELVSARGCLSGGVASTCAVDAPRPNPHWEMFEGKANAWIRHDELCEPERRQRSSPAGSVSELAVSALCKQPRTIVTPAFQAATSADRQCSERRK